jgi:hypothetical protein
MRAKTKKELQMEVEDLRNRLLKAEEDQLTLRTLMEYVPEGITIADAPEGRIRMVSSYGGISLGVHMTGAPQRKWRATGKCTAKMELG